MEDNVVRVIRSNGSIVTQKQIQAQEDDLFMSALKGILQARVFNDDANAPVADVARHFFELATPELRSNFTRDMRLAVNKLYDNIAVCYPDIQEQA